VSTPTITHPASVEELKRAYRALQSGVFADPTSPTSFGGTSEVWVPTVGEQPVVVAGVGGGVGATTVALAIASVIQSSRLIECCPANRSGLVAASYTELGEQDGWLQGQRDHLRLERRGDHFTHLADLPKPRTSSGPITSVLDAGWSVERLTEPGTWLHPLLGSAPIVLVARSTVPGLRQLETALGRLAACDVIGAALIGPPRKRWPKQLNFNLGPITRRLDDDEQLICVETDPQLALAGLDGNPLPRKVAEAGTTLANLIPPTSSSNERHLS
jgi:hypothetical protein